MKKYKSKLNIIVITILFIILTSVIIIQSLHIAALSSTQTNEQRARIWDTKLIYACYNYKIQPCDDKNVTIWNEQHPDKAITEAYLRDPEF